MTKIDKLNRYIELQKEALLIEDYEGAHELQYLIDRTMGLLTEEEARQFLNKCKTQ